MPATSIAPTMEAWCSTKLAWPRWAQLKRCIASCFEGAEDVEDVEEGFSEEEEEEDFFSAAAEICSGVA